jgi:hypothetical protein
MERRTDMIEKGIDMAEIRDRQTNKHRTDVTIPDFPSVGSAKPARFVIIPANAEKNVIAIN